MKRFFNWFKSLFKKKPLFIPAAKECPCCKQIKLVPAFGPEDEQVWARFGIGKWGYLGAYFNAEIWVCLDCHFISMNYVK